MSELIIRTLGLQEYKKTLDEMQRFTDSRTEDTQDEIWLLEHLPVITLGQNGRSEHILTNSDIPIVQSDRGGQVTYHGPGQLVVYLMVDIRRKGGSVRKVVNAIEQSVIKSLKSYGLSAYAETDAPGVYVAGKKICSLGLRIRRGCTFHGLALNVNMDLSPFHFINPCGYPGLEMTQIADLSGPTTVKEIAPVLVSYLREQLDIFEVE